MEGLARDILGFEAIRWRPVQSMILEWIHYVVRASAKRLVGEG